MLAQAGHKLWWCTVCFWCGLPPRLFCMAALQTALWIWQWGKQLAGEALPALAALPPTCKEALAHAALVCTGSSPSYFPSGWGPCCLCWGWFLLGAGLGVAGTVVFFSAMPASRLRFGHARPTWHAAAEAVLASAGGPAELRGLAAQAGLPAEDLLCQLLREATRFPATTPAGSQQNALARGTGTRRRGGRPPPTEAHVSAER